MLYVVTEVIADILPTDSLSFPQGCCYLIPYRPSHAAGSGNQQLHRSYSFLYYSCQVQGRKDNLEEFNRHKKTIGQTALGISSFFMK